MLATRHRRGYKARSLRAGGADTALFAAVVFLRFGRARPWKKRFGGGAAEFRQKNAVHLDHVFFPRFFGGFQARFGERF